MNIENWLKMVYYNKPSYGIIPVFEVRVWIKLSSKVQEKII